MSYSIEERFPGQQDLTVRFVREHLSDRKVVAMLMDALLDQSESELRGYNKYHACREVRVNAGTLVWLFDEKRGTLDTFGLIVATSPLLYKLVELVRSPYGHHRVLPLDKVPSLEYIARLMFVNLANAIGPHFAQMAKEVNIGSESVFDRLKYGSQQRPSAGSSFTAGPRFGRTTATKASRLLRKRGTRTGNEEE